MLVIIAAIGINNELGKNNQLLWSLPSDLRFFREKTINKKVIVGSKTYESLNGPLKNRIHYVLDFNKVISDNENVIYTNDYYSLVKEFIDSDEEVFVIGGASIYKLFLNDTDKMYLTEINASDEEADTYFPTFNKDEWETSDLGHNEDNGISYKHVLYTRKK
jgi:dihydrofolate reductase